MALNIVLITPEIPNNTGNIGRLALATGARLHLVKPLGFEITNTRLKRAGLDYWKHIDVVYYDSINAFFKKNSTAKLAFFSSHAKNTFWSIDFEDDLFLIFGKESSGLPKYLAKDYSKYYYSIPLYSENIRSLNLANAVSVVVYEGLRQLNV